MGLRDPSIVPTSIYLALKMVLCFVLTLLTWHNSLFEGEKGEVSKPVKKVLGLSVKVLPRYPKIVLNLSRGATAQIRTRSGYPDLYSQP